MTAAAPGRSLVEQAWRYAATGVANTAFGLSVIVALHIWGQIGVTVANATGYLFGLLLSYVLNRNWTFAHGGSARKTLPRYLALVLGAFGVNLLMINCLQAAEVAYLPAQLAGTSVYSLLVFLGARSVVFRPPRQPQ